MRNRNNFFFLAIFILLLTACKKEGGQYVIEDGTFGANALQASATTVVLTQPTENSNAVTFNWSPARFGEKTVVNYTLQLTLPADTSDSNPWSDAKSFNVGNSTTYDFVAKALNDLLNTMGLSTGTPNKVAVRIKADVPQYNGAASSIRSAYSNAVVLNITSYSLILYIPGEYQGWNPGTAPELRPAEGKAGMYEGYAYMPGVGTRYFKYTNARDWNHTNYGDGGNGTFSIDGNAGGLNVPTGGYYQLTADLNTNKWTATKTTWSIIGDATPGGWNNDTQMTYDETAQVWKVTVNMVSNGSFKFRANNAWAINFGIDATGKLKYADHPFFGSIQGINNITVPSSGNYIITLDLHQSQQYMYNLVKN